MKKVSNHIDSRNNVKNHYTVSINSDDLSRGFVIDRRTHKFDQGRPNFITSATISFIPKGNQPILDNVLHDNIIKVNTVPYTINKGSYSISELIAEINEILIDVGSVSVITEGGGFGLAKLYMKAFSVIDFSEADDIRDILKLDPVYSTNANKTYKGNGVIDITRNLQNIQIYCSMLNASTCKISNSNNDLLCTVSIESLEQTCTEKIQNLMIPVYPLVNYVELIFKNQNGLTLTLNCDFAITFHISSFKNIDYSNNTEQITNLCLECRSANNDIELNQTFVLPNKSYISRVSILFTGAINNITENQEICIDGEYITIKKAMYTLESLLSELNTLNAVFTIITEGANAFKIQVTNFSYISLTNAQQIKEILGFEYDHISLKSEGKRYILDSTANRLVIHRVYQDDNVVLTLDTGVYNFMEFIDVIKQKLSQYIKLKSVEDRGTYLEFVSNDKFYFDRANSTIHNYYWTHWFNFDPTLRNHYIEKPDMNFDRREDNIFINDDQFIQIDYELGVNDSRYFRPTNFRININNDTSLTYTIEGNYTRKSLAVFLRDKVNSLYKTLGYTDNLVRVINNDEIVLVEGKTKFFIIESVDTTIINKIADSHYKCDHWKSSESFSPVETVNICNDIHYRFKIDDYPWQYRTIPHGTYSITNLCNYFIDHMQAWVNNNTKYKDIFYYLSAAQWNYGCRGFRHNGGGLFSFECDYPLIRNISNGKPIYSIQNHKGDNTGFSVGPFKQDIHAYINNRLYTGAVDTTSIPNGSVNTVPHIYSDFNYTRLPINHTWLMNRMKEVSMGYIKSVVVNESEYHIPYRFFYKNNPTTIYFCDKDKKIQTPLLMSKEYIETMPKITTLFRNLTYNAVNIKGKTLTIKIEGVEHELNPSQTFTTQYQIVQRLNKLLTENNIQIQWRLGNEGYYLIYDKGAIELSGSLSSFFGSNLVKTNANKYVLKYVDNCVYFSGDGFSQLLSDKLVNLTNNKEMCNIYCSLVKGKADNLLTTMEVTDLTKNYKSISNLNIPINNTFDSIQVNLRDNKDEYYEFNGVLYLMLTVAYSNT